ncbi:MAG: ribosome small subunit-dependent GTPase A [Gemmatimonadaceae bacterium]|nr:ribosome small subunit-dependent GTPase A [Gemmatimonadaceae bacterium]
MTDPGTLPTPMLGRVLGGTGGIWRVQRTDGGEVVDAALRGRLKRHDDAKAKQARADRDGNRARASVRSRATERTDDLDAPALKLAVGDEVQLEQDGDGGSWTIAAIQPRRSQLARRAPGGAHGERIVAANVDQVLLVFAAANPEPHPRMIDRFLIIAEANDIAARVVINKSDLVSPESVRLRFADYERAGYPVHVTSTTTGRGLDALRGVLEDRTTVLSGPSGVGKSSLMNAMFAGLDLRVGEISQSVNKGRHTTVGALLHPLPGGGYVVDTPGLREIGMWGLTAEHLDGYFPEFRPFLGECRFADCVHVVEPGCAVREARARDVISATRYDTYVRLLDELAGEAASWEKA